jgi:transposase InsO family protein
MDTNTGSSSKLHGKPNPKQDKQSGGSSDNTNSKKDINEYLSSIYYDPLHPGSYSGVQKFWTVIKNEKDVNVTYKQVREWLKRQEGYVRHKPPPRVFPRQKILMSSLDQQWDADIMDMQKCSRQNSGYRFLGVFIDIFSRYVWVIPMKTKKNEDMLRAIHKIFKTGRKPQYLRTDQGTEYMGKYVQHYLKKNNVHHFTALNPLHANYAERMIKTLKGKIYRFFTANQTHRYIDHLEDIVESYQNTIHTSTNMRPVDITEKNSQAVYEKLYLPQQIALENKPIKYAFEIGVRVHMAMDRSVFHKAYKETYFQEIFEISVRMPTHPPRYKLIDLLKNEIKGTFYEQQLIKVPYDYTSDMQMIKRVMRYRKGASGKEALIRWEGYSPSYDTWLRVQDIVKYV